MIDKKIYGSILRHPRSDEEAGIAGRKNAQRPGAKGHGSLGQMSREKPESLVIHKVNKPLDSVNSLIHRRI